MKSRTGNNIIITWTSIQLTLKPKVLFTVVIFLPKSQETKSKEVRDGRYKEKEMLTFITKLQAAVHNLVHSIENFSMKTN